MSKDDELLDKVIAHLRSERAPEMPLDFAIRRSVSSSHWKWCVAAATAAAATVVGYFLMHERVPESAKQPAPFTAKDSLLARVESDAIVNPVDLIAPLAELEAGLAAIDVQIDELRKQAALLDARRRADAMLAQY